MATGKFSNRDFIIKDLVISVGRSGRGGAWLPGPDDETPPSPISPIASVVANLGLIEVVRYAVQDALQNQRFDSIAKSFISNPLGAADPEGDPAIQTAIRDIGTAVVASAVYAALGGNSVGLVDPDKTFDTIPTPLTPIVHKGFEIHRVAELPRLKHQLAETIAYVDRAIAAQAPKANDLAAVRTQLEGALKNLPR
jgi:hypothetical protein